MPFLHYSYNILFADWFFWNAVARACCFRALLLSPVAHPPRVVLYTIAGDGGEDHNGYSWNTELAKKQDNTAIRNLCVLYENLCPL